MNIKSGWTGLKCPRCGSEEYSFDFPEIPGTGEVVLRTVCQDCKGNFSEYYNLSVVESDDSGSLTYLESFERGWEEAGIGT